MQEEISFGTWLRKQRRALDVSQKSLADQVGCAEVTLRRIEAGTLKPSKELASILLEKIGIPKAEWPQWISFARGLSGFPSQSPSSTNKQKSNLPVPLTTFIGREKEQSEVIQFITKYRLVTLTGAGGVGKTRLSIKVGEQILGSYADGVWLVELAPILDSLLVPRTTAITIGLRDEPQRPVIDMLCDYLQEKQLLIVLDNCEHLLDACAQLADTLLKRCPDLKIIATSREALGILGEAVYPVPSLRLPEIQQLIEKFRDYESIRLFEERAQLVRMDFSLTIETASSVAIICNRLDGIPLAIELAAARVSTFSIDQIAARLDESFSFLSTGNRTALPRHQTLRAAIDWSYRLLSLDEQILFQRLSVFVGGWTLEAVESVCSDANIPAEVILGLLSQLINKSLVVAQEEYGKTRYRMLETIRQYANEKLFESGESGTLRNRHLEYFLNLAETAEPHLTRPEQLEWLVQLDGEYENLRFALESALRKASAESSLRLCAALGMFWSIRCYWLEGSKWLANALARPSQDQAVVEKAARVRALCQDTEIAQQVDELERMKTSSELALKLAQEVSSKRDIIVAKFYLGWALERQGDNKHAVLYMKESFNEAQGLNDPYWEAVTYLWVGIVQSWIGVIQFNHAKCKPIEHALRSVALARQAGERNQLAKALIEYSVLLCTYERRDEAKQCFQEVQQLSKQMNSNANNLIFITAQLGLALIEWLDGNLQHARTLLMASQAPLHILGERWTRSICIECLGLLSMEADEIIQAEIYLEEALSIAREIEVEYVVARRLALLSILLYLQGNMEKSKQNFRESISLIKDLHPYLRVFFLEILFISPYFQIPENSVLLLGALSSFLTKFDIPMDSLYTLEFLLRPYYVRAEARARESLGEVAFETAFAEGQKISLDEALDLALKTVEEI